MSGTKLWRQHSSIDHTVLLHLQTVSRAVEAPEPRCPAHPPVLHTVLSGVVPCLPIVSLPSSSAVWQARSTSQLHHHSNRSNTSNPPSAFLIFPFDPLLAKIASSHDGKLGKRKLSNPGDSLPLQKKTMTVSCPLSLSSCHHRLLSWKLSTTFANRPNHSSASLKHSPTTC